MRKTTAALAAAAVLGALGLHARADMAEWDSKTGNKDAAAGYAQGLDAAKKEDYSRAAKLFEEAAAKDPKNADILTMLAYSQRKLGDLDAAFANYKKALELDPKSAQAREYLGEAHLQAALKELSALGGLGDKGKQEAAKLKTALKAAAAKL